MDGNAPSPALRILAVDDDRDTTDSARLILEIAGYEVVAVYEAEAALRIAQTQSLDAVLLDLAMPRMDGIALTKELRRNPGTKEAVLICISGHHEEELRKRMQGAGCDYYFVKPVDWRSLIPLLDRLAAKKRTGLTVP